MPYSKSPSVSTYDTKRQNFVIGLQNRVGSDLTKDSKLLNMVIEVLETPDKQNQRIYVKSRPGLGLVYNTTGLLGRGCFYWTVGGVGYTIYIIGNQILVNGTLLSTIATSVGTVGFTEHVNATGTVTLFMCDGTNGYVFSSPTVAPTLITSVDFPTPHIPHPIFLDGYIFVAKAGTQDIYNCDLNTPDTWTAGNYVSAEMYPDKIVALSKNNNYIYAVGSNSVEYFYDAGGTTTPLARHDSAVQQFGTPAPHSVVQTEKEVILVGATANGGHTVWTIDGFKEKEIGTPPVRSILRAQGGGLAEANAFSVRTSGQKLYVLVLSGIILVYSFDTDMWYEWTSSWIKYSCDGPNGTAYIQGPTGVISAISEEFHSDLGFAYTCQIVTPKYDFDVYNKKTCSRFSLLGDIPSLTTTAAISWTDDDYTTWATDRTLSFANDYAAITQLGMFRRRAFRITFNEPSYAIRLEGFEIDINKGTQ